MQNLIGTVDKLRSEKRLMDASTVNSQLSNCRCINSPIKHKATFFSCFHMPWNCMSHELASVGQFIRELLVQPHYILALSGLLRRGVARLECYDLINGLDK